MAFAIPQTTWKERDQAQANFDFATGKLVIPRSSLPPQADPRLAAAYPIVTDPNFDIQKPDTNNFAPRIGFAFRPFGDNKTVIRGGRGLRLQHAPGLHRIPADGLYKSAVPACGDLRIRRRANSLCYLARPFPGAGAPSPNPAITIVENQIKNSVS